MRNRARRWVALPIAPVTESGSGTATAPSPEGSADGIGDRSGRIRVRTQRRPP